MRMSHISVNVWMNFVCRYYSQIPLDPTIDTIHGTGLETTHACTMSSWCLHVVNQNVSG